MGNDFYAGLAKFLSDRKQGNEITSENVKNYRIDLNNLSWLRASSNQTNLDNLKMNSTFRIWPSLTSIILRLAQFLDFSVTLDRILALEGV